MPLDATTIAFKRAQIASLREAHPTPSAEVQAAIDRLEGQIGPSSEDLMLAARQTIDGLTAEVARLQAALAAATAPPPAPAPAPAPAPGA